MRSAPLHWLDQEDLIAFTDREEVFVKVAGQPPAVLPSPAADRAATAPSCNQCTSRES